MRECVRAVVVRGGKLLAMRRDKFGDKYYTLIGGGIQPGETREQALGRELLEESGLILTASRLVFVDTGLPGFGPQYIYLCEAEGGEPRLDPGSEEARDSLSGNRYEPVWLDAGNLAGLPLRPDSVARAIDAALASGFPQEPVILEGRLVEGAITVQAEEGQGYIHGPKT